MKRFMYIVLALILAISAWEDGIDIRDLLEVVGMIIVAVLRIMDNMDRK